MNLDNPIWKVFDLDNNLIKEYRYWMLLVRKNNVKLGSCVAILKRDAFPLLDVLPDEMAEYATLAKEIESALGKSFKPHLVSYLALMFVDKHIHFHIIPRYKNIIDFAGIQWEDDNQPNTLFFNKEMNSHKMY